MAAPNILTLQSEPLADPWRLFTLELAGFPVPAKILKPLRTFLQLLSTALVEDWNLNQEVLVQFDRLEVADASARFAENGSAWIPETGLAVWPDRKPPAQWTMKEFLDFVPGRMAVLMYQYFRITKSPEAKEHARDVMLGYGTVAQMFSPVDWNALKSKGDEVLLSTIEDPSFRAFPFYLPIFELKALRNATSEQLDKWSCGVTVYVRESSEDNALLIACRQPLEPLLAKLGGAPDDTAPNKWSIPVSE